MPLAASDVLDRARRILLDETSVRWPLPELVLWLNDGLRELVTLKPSSTAAPVILPMRAGTLQELPAEHISLLRVVRNIEALPASPGAPPVPGRAIRICPRDQLDTLNPDWHRPERVPFATQVRHYVYDETAPRVFYVYPGNDGEGLVEAIVSKMPALVELPASAPDELSSYVGIELDVHEIYGAALVDYVLYRAYSKDAQFAGNAARAGAHYGQFQGLIGVKGAAEAATTPNAARSVATG